MDALLKVLIADDHPLMLQGIRRTLDESEDIESRR
jgi:DNA-binding NarL/FixJ family response regulator